MPPETPRPENFEELRFRPSEPRIATTAELKRVKLGRHAEIGPRCVLREVTVGDFSYFERGGEAVYTSIGKFCSIAANVRINALAHPMERLTTHKISYRPNEYFRWLPVDQSVIDRRKDDAVTIGHDVWIGHAVVIMPGVFIGNGAVIGAGAVVTRDVAPFTVVAGVPAQPIKPRFAEPIATRIAALAWWDWPPETLYDAIPDMQALPIEAFLDKWEGRQPFLPSTTTK
ncbi:antibiotic acetyltransferase [Jiella sp. MQZ9-1]|uniref:Antibiotic acetyltransferase n=1 Tax=Jiella flava TaxID=2816857 RepID=A0A939JWW1_9HYPH|nr:DapH/DapD/GlmU-related protein [Jiella flava]MBO0663442.1 antibiotic acetyltransferase [Jiella flava]MCD2472018.1 antibiotic acetyltransferase [Jiella flava]